MIFKENPKKVKPVKQLAATGLLRIRRLLLAFDCDIHDLPRWYGILETEFGSFKIYPRQMVRSETVKFYWAPLTLRRGVKRFVFHLFDHNDQLVASRSLDCVLKRGFQLTLTWDIEA
jgi:hypothetical protein